MADRRDEIIDAEVEPVRAGGAGFRAAMNEAASPKRRLPAARTWFGALLIVLLVLAAGAVIWFRQGGDSSGTTTVSRADSIRIAALERRLGDMESAWRNELRQVDQRLKALETRSADTASGGDPAALEALRQQIDALHRQADGNAQHLGDIDNRLGGATDAVAGLGQRLGTVESKIAAENGERLMAAQRAVAFALALGQLRTAAHAGPYQAELAALSRIDSGDDARAAIQRLDRFAPGGVPGLAQLQARFPALIPVLLAVPPASDSVWDRLWARLRRLVTIRHTGEATGQSDDAVVARAERRVQDGNLAAALDELGALPQIANEPVAGWMTDARNRVAIDAALKDLDGAALARLSDMPAGAPHAP